LHLLFFSCLLAPRDRPFESFLPIATRLGRLN
jgi:hypothetical protein